MYNEQKMGSFLVNVLLIGLVCCFADAIMFNLPPNTQKCLRDDMQAHQLILGEYEIVDAPGQNIDYVVCKYFLLPFFFYIFEFVK